MVKLPDQFHLFPTLLRSLCHVGDNIGLFHLLEGIEEADGGFVEAQFIDWSHSDILPQTLDTV
jgi:hypothetical protein